MSSIPLMLEYVSGLSSRPGDRAAAGRILAHEDYRFELRRYGIPSAEHLIDYFSRLNTIAPEEIPDLSGDHRKNHLREKHSKWLDCLRDPRKYEDRYERLKALFTDDFLAEMQGRLAGMFPEGTDMIPDPAVVSTLSFGRSFGYPHEGAIHLDLFGIDEYASPEDLPRIFERGFTGYNGRMDKRATGIGLYLSREICRKLGHTITVESELGKGTRVTVGLARPYLEVE